MASHVHIGPNTSTKNQVRIELGENNFAPHSSECMVMKANRGFYDCNDEDLL